MKILFFPSLLVATLFLTGCETHVVEHHGDYYRPHGYYSNYHDYHHAYREGFYGAYYGPDHVSHETVVVTAHPSYHAATVTYHEGHAVYYSDKHGRYYVRNGHKVYVKYW